MNARHMPNEDDAQGWAIGQLCGEDADLTKRRTPSYEEFSAALALEDGLLFWKIGYGKAKPGEIAGVLNKQGYFRIGYKQKTYLSHRVVWLLTYGKWPEGRLDHKDGNPKNNAIANLRVATPSQNRANTRKNPNTSSPYVGVVLHKKSGRFQAQCRRRYLGIFSSPEEAARAYDAYAKQQFGEFAKLNFGSQP